MPRRFAVLALLSMVAVTAAAEETLRTVSTTGEATVYVVPDQVLVNFGVESFDADLEASRKRNDEASRRMVNAVRKLGIPEKQIQADHAEVRIALLFLFPGLVAAGRGLAAEESSRTPLAVARQEAESNAKSPAGKRYEGVLVSKLEAWLRPALERCVKTVPKEELISFDGFVRVSAEGKAEEVLFGPETAVARCVAPEFASAKYPSPPEPSWWVKIEVRLK